MLLEARDVDVITFIYYCSRSGRQTLREVLQGDEKEFDLLKRKCVREKE